MASRVVESFLATVASDKVTVVSFPEYVAVFGGAISKVGGRAKLESQRDAFVRWVKANRSDLNEVLLLPENYEDWNDFDVYSDLLLFEKDLGYVTSAVVVFLESPGAIAELGAFSQIDSLSERLLVVVTDNRHPKKSFISLGPIRNLHDTRKHPFCVCVIPDPDPLSAIRDHLPVVVDNLDSKRSSAPKTQEFSNAMPQHEILLVLDLINLFLIATVLELKEIAEHFGVKLGLARLDQILFVLERTQLVTGKHYGNTKYFVARRFRKAYLDFTSREGARSFNRDRFKAERLGEIQTDQNRKNAYQLAMKEAK